MHIYLCEDSIDGIFTGVYDAWASKFGHANVKLSLAVPDTMELFSEYHSVPVDNKKSYKVARTIQSRLGFEVYETLCRSSLAKEPAKADAIYRVIVAGLAQKDGHRIMEHLSYSPVHLIFRLNKTVWNESHHYFGFVRFAELENGVLFSKISPKHNVLPILGEHFSDRFPEENFVLYDDIRKIAVLHRKKTPFLLVDETLLPLADLPDYSTDELRMQGLWCTFHQSIAIEGRINPKLQGTMLPHRFRNHMPEFSDVHSAKSFL